MKILNYPPISRGMNITIPVFICDENEEALNISDYSLEFTLKSQQYDYDYDDSLALIKKTAVLVNLEKSEFHINLSSKDTWLPPGNYYMDLVIKKGNNQGRIFLAETEIVGGPHNRDLFEDSEDFLFGKPISLGLYQTNPLKVIVNKSLGAPRPQKVIGEPKHLVEEINGGKKVVHYVARLEFSYVVKLNPVPIWRTSPLDNAPIGSVKDSPFKDLVLAGDGDKIWIENLNSDFASEYFLTTGDDGEIKALKQIEVPIGSSIIIHFYFKNQLFKISGLHCKNTWMFDVKWFDFN